MLVLGGGLVGFRLVKHGANKGNVYIYAEHASFIHSVLLYLKPSHDAVSQTMSVQRQVLYSRTL